LRLALPRWQTLLRTAGGKLQPATLDRRHVYILPSKAGLLFALMIVGMLIGSINYSLNMGYVLAFWLMGLGIVAMLHTWRNLAHLHVAAGKVSSVFAGENARFSLIISDQNGRSRSAIGLKTGANNSKYSNVPAYGFSEITLDELAQKRGWMKLPKVSIFTRFPLGLFHTWGYVDCEVRCLVYPSPAAHGSPLPSLLQQSHAQGLHTTKGDEDFSGLRNYRLGDSMRRVDWKASAREQGLYTKEFEGQGQFSPWLDWETTPGKDVEARLSQLTRWVLDAHTSGLAFGLRLPNVTLKPASDETHFREALKALALL